MSGTGPYWSIILPVARQNLVLNPSYEIGSAGAAAIESATLARSSDRQYMGAYSLQVTPAANGTSGAIVGSFVTAAAGSYAVSLAARLPSGSSYTWGVANTSNAYQSSGTLTGGGTWHRYDLFYGDASAATTRRVILKKRTGGAGNDAYFVDAVQAEAGSVTTYLDGDQEGCQWLGQPHAAPSQRSGQSRAGGTVITLASAGFIVDESPGIGMPSVTNAALPYAFIDGAEYQRTRVTERSFTLTSTLIGTTWEGLHTTRRAIIDLIKPDLTTDPQPARFWYTGGQGTVQVDAVYSGGFEFGEPNGFSEIAELRMTAYDPYWRTTQQQGTAMLGYSTVAMAALAARDPQGRWYGVRDNATGSALQDSPVVQALVEYQGSVLIGGSFGLGNLSPRNAGAWNANAQAFGSVWQGSTQGPVYAIAAGDDGSVYYGGSFTTVFPAVTMRNLIVASSRNIGAPGVLSGTNNAYGSLIPENAAGVQSLLYLGGGSLMIGGEIRFSGTNAFGFAYMNTATGTPTPVTGGTIGLGVTGNRAVYALINGPGGSVYLAGNFVNAGGVAGTSIAQWNGAFRATDGTGIISGLPQVQTLVNLKDGRIAAGGAFVAVKSGTVSGVTAWNNVAYSGFGSGLSAQFPDSNVRELAVDDQGGIYAVGSFVRLSGVTYGNGLGFAYWNGASWVPGDVLLPSFGTALLQASDGTLYVGGGFSGTGTAAYVTSVVNAGRAVSYPTFTITNNATTGTAQIYQIANTLTDDTVYFRYGMQPGEQITLKTDPQTRGLTSTRAGNILSAILPGSNFSSLRLAPGTNVLSFLSDGPSVTVAVSWQPRHWSADGGTAL